MTETTHSRDEKIHLGLILDGNRRWARSRGILSPVEGHKQGFRTLVDNIIPTLSEGIKYKGRTIEVDQLSLYGFSTQNWKRSEKEVADLMQFMQHEIAHWVEELITEDVKLIFAGDIEDLEHKQPVLADKIKQAVIDTQENTTFQMNLCLNYHGQEEIMRAIERAADSGIDAHQMTREDLQNHLEIPRGLDLLVRTSGEQRISGFMNWQINDAEIIFEKRFLPNVGKRHVRGWLKEYAKRNRRFGGN